MTINILVHIILDFYLLSRLLYFESIYTHCFITCFFFLSHSNVRWTAFHKLKYSWRTWFKVVALYCYNFFSQSFIIKYLKITHFPQIRGKSWTSWPSMWKSQVKNSSITLWYQLLCSYIKVGISLDELIKRTNWCSPSVQVWVNK